MATHTPLPSWYTAEDAAHWGVVKEAFQRDWQQTQRDFGAAVPNLNQQVGDTVSQAVGSEPVPPVNVPTPHSSETDVYRDEDEPAYRYGYAAYQRYATDDLDDLESHESELLRDWKDRSVWNRQYDAIRRGWNYGRMERRIMKPR